MPHLSLNAASFPILVLNSNLIRSFKVLPYFSNSS
nr:MAG TPA: hypothetical protein [Caudoviricetes sp.]